MITVVLVAAILLVPTDADSAPFGLGWGIALAVSLAIRRADSRRRPTPREWRRPIPREWEFWVFPLVIGEAGGIAGAVHFSHPLWLLGGPAVLLLNLAISGAGVLLKRRHQLVGFVILPKEYRKR